MQNISPFSKRVPKAPKTVRVSLGAIGESCEYDRELVGSILKDVVFKFVSSFLSMFLMIYFRLSKTAKERNAL